MKNEQVCGALYESEWMDVGTPERLASLEGKIVPIHFKK
jgi:hypothetical protein